MVQPENEVRPINKMNLNRSKIFRIMEAMSEPQRKDFGEFLQSPYFNTRPQITDLYQILLQELKELDPELPTSKWEVYNQLFKTNLNQEAYSEKEDKHLRKVLSDVSQKAEEYLRLASFGKQKALHSWMLIRAYGEIGLPQFYAQTLRKFRKDYPRTYVGGSALLAHYLLDDEEYNYSQRGGEITGVSQLPGESLDRFFLIQKLKLLCEKVIAREVINQQFEQRFEKEVIEMASHPDLKDDFSIRFYLNILQLYRGGEAILLDKMRNDLKLQKGKQELEELIDMYNYLQNYCIWKIYHGPEIQDVLMKIYLDRIEVCEVIYPRDLQNMVTLAIRLHDLARGQLILEAGLPKIPRSHFANTRDFNEAHLAYANGDYERARKKLQNVDRSRPYDLISCRVLEIKAWWMKGDEEEFVLALVNSFCSFLGRMEQLPPARRENYLKVFRLAYRVIRDRFKRRALLRHRTKLMQLPDGTNKGFVLERIDEYLEETLE